MGRELKQTLSQGRHLDGQPACEKMLSMTDPQGNAKQNHNEISPHTCQNGFYQKKTSNKCW